MRDVAQRVESVRPQWLRRLVGLLAGAIVFPAPGAFCQPGAPDEFEFRRLVGEEETWAFDIDRSIYREGSLIYWTAATSSHSVLSGPPRGEFVRITRLTKYADTEPIDLSGMLAASPGFALALDADPAPAPPASAGLDPTLSGLIADLRAALIWARDAGALRRLRRIGDVVESTTSWRYAWPDGTRVIVSDDCLQGKLALADLTLSKAVVKVTLGPPEASCLAIKEPWIREPVDPDGRPNNIEQVVAGTNSLRVSWGREEVSISATLDRRTGALLSAELENTRLLREKTGCSGSLEHCSPPVSTRLRRLLRLKRR